MLLKRSAFRCWPELNEPYIATSACMVMGLLLGNGELTAAGCEGDGRTIAGEPAGEGRADAAAAAENHVHCLPIHGCLPRLRPARAAFVPRRG